MADRVSAEWLARFHCGQCDAAIVDAHLDGRWDYEAVIERRWVMASHYTCDRCGRDCEKNYGRFTESVDLMDWNGGKPVPQVERLALSLEVLQDYRDGDVPDLCDLCLIDVLLAFSEAVLLRRKAARRHAAEEEIVREIREARQRAASEDDDHAFQAPEEPEASRVQE